MKEFVSYFFKGIFATFIIGISGQLYWNYYVVEKLGIGKVVEDPATFTVGAFILYTIFYLFSEENGGKEIFTGKFTWMELISLLIGNLFLIFLFK